MSAVPYADQFEMVRFERREGILQVTFHTDGDSLRWGRAAVEEMLRAFAAISTDVDTRVVILTGAGDEFNGPKGSNASFPHTDPAGWESAHYNTRKLLMNLLDIEAPVISAINGPVWRHVETPLLSDVVLASDTTVFQDSGHFANGLVPADGVHLVLPVLMGLNRARYFMLTNQEIRAVEAREMGLVNEVLPKDQLLPRAWELAETIIRQAPLVTKYTRVAFVHQLRQLLVAQQGYGLLLEGMGVMSQTGRRGYALDERT